MRARNRRSRLNRIVPIALVLGVCLLSSCSSGAPLPATHSSVRRAFFALSVSDLERSTTWYADNLGFKVQLRNNPSANGPRGVILSRDDALLELLEFPSAKSRSDLGLPEDSHLVYGIFKIGFEVTDVDALFASVKDRHLRLFFPLVRPPGSSLRTFAVFDPDGNIVQFFGK